MDTCTFRNIFFDGSRSSHPVRILRHLGEDEPPLVGIGELFRRSSASPDAEVLLATLDGHRTDIVIYGGNIGSVSLHTEEKIKHAAHLMVIWCSASNSSLIVIALVIFRRAYSKRSSFTRGSFFDASEAKLRSVLH